MRLGADGNVGIGTPSPATKLSIITAAGGNTSGLSVGSTNGLLNIWGGSTSDVVVDVTNGTLNGSTATNLIIRGGGTERMRIASDGKIGIGNITPQSLTHLYSATGINSPSLGTGGGHFMIQTGGVIATVMGVNINGNFYIQPQRINGGGTNVYNTLLNPSGGNVGIGTTSPTARLTVNVGSGEMEGLNLRDGANATAAFVYSSVTGENRIGGIASYAFPTFYSGANERMRITSTGNVGIGTTSPATRFDVTTSINSFQIVRFENTSNTSGNGILVTSLGSNCNNTSSYHLIAATGGADKFYIYGNGVFATVSDKRLKKNIKTVEEKYLEKVLALDVVNYNWNDQEDESKFELGLIAQQVEESIPFIINENRADENGNIYKSIQVSALPYILIKAMQEQNEILEQLKEEIEILKNK
jgi:hypothetical protein